MPREEDSQRSYRDFYAGLLGVGFTGIIMSDHPDAIMLAVGLTALSMAMYATSVYLGARGDSNGA